MGSKKVEKRCDIDTDIRHYNVAGIHMSIQGVGEYADALRDYFRTEEIQDLGGSVSLSIIVSNNPEEVLIPAQFYSLSGKISFNESEYCVKKKNCIYSVSNLFSSTGSTVLRLCYTRKKSLLHTVRVNLLNSSVDVSSSKDEFIFSVMNYQVFLYIFALVLMKQRKLFIHCAMVERYDKALILVGTSGCGKTSTLFKFVEDEKCRYMAEDFGVCGCDGYAHYMPKKMTIYESDAKYENILILQSLKQLTFWQRMRWKFFILLGLNPSFHPAPEQVFNKDKIAKESKIETVIFLSRVGGGGTEISKLEINQAELCTKIRYAAFRELGELNEILNNIRAVGDENTRKAYPELHKIEEEYEHMLFEMLFDKRIGVMEVPLKAIPEDIMNNILG